MLITPPAAPIDQVSLESMVQGGNHTQFQINDLLTQCAMVLHFFYIVQSLEKFIQHISRNLQHVFLWQGPGLMRHPEWHMHARGAPFYTLRSTFHLTIQNHSWPYKDMVPPLSLRNSTFTEKNHLTIQNHSWPYKGMISRAIPSDHDWSVNPI